MTQMQVGDQHIRTAGNATIVLQRTDLTFTVNTYIGPVRADAWSFAYATKAEAADAANHTRDAFKAHGTDVAIDNRRAALTAEYHQVALRQDRASKAKAARLNMELDALATLADRARLKDLGASVVGFLSDAA